MPATQEFDLQHTAIERGITLLEASAGTGKTFTLAGLVLRLLLERKAKDITRILVVTFTNAATDELTSRIRERLRDAVLVFNGQKTKDPLLLGLYERHSVDPRSLPILEGALRRFDEVMITTIHGFCKRVLDSAAFETGMPFVTEFIQDETKIQELAALDFWRRRIYPDAFLAGIAVARGWTPEQMLRDYRCWRNHPEAELLPPGENLGNAAARLRLVLESVVEKWCFCSGEIQALAASLPLNKDAYLGTDELVEDLNAAAAGEWSALLYAIARLTPEKVRSQVSLTRHKAPVEHGLFSRCGEAVNALSLFAHSYRAAFVREVDEAVRADKEKQGLLSFDDLLSTLDRVLSQDSFAETLIPAVSRQFDAALIDEFQDTDPLQCRIFTRLFSAIPLFFIGDPKQAIYSFRGADIHAYLEARSAAVRRYTLDRNYRSSSAMVAGVNALFARAQNSFLYPEISFRPVMSAGGADNEPLAGDAGSALTWWFLPPDANGKVYSKEAASLLILSCLAAEVVALLRGGMTLGGRALRPADIAVLVRTRLQAAEVQAALAEVSVPSVLCGTGNVLESEECEELTHILFAILSPADDQALKSAMATRLWGWSARRILRLDGDEAARQGLTHQLEAYFELWKSDFMPMFERLLADQGIRTRLLASPDGDRRLTNLIHLAELLHQAAEEGGLSPEGLLLWLGRSRQRGLDNRESTELRLESDAAAVQIVTVHSCKGLEYEIVFSPFLWDCRPHHADEPALARASGRVVLDYGSEAKAFHDSVAETDRLAEDLRLCYVALTRARHRCYVVWGMAGKESFRSSLSYLLHQPLLEEMATEKRAAQAMEHALAVRDDWADELSRFAGANESMTMSVLAMPAKRECWRVETALAVTLSPRIWPLSSSTRARQLTGWRMVSYSSLAAGREAERPDHEDPPASLEARVAPPQPAKGIHAFPRGSSAGTCLHEIFERSHFQESDPGVREALVREVLIRHHLLGSEEAGWVGVVADMVGDVLAVTLPGPEGGLSLTDLRDEDRFVEWPFYLPVKGLVPSDLADRFALHATGWTRDTYGPQLRGLSHECLAGYLSGFIDLLFCHGNRWYIVDWKSNHLGNGSEAYGQESLRQEMAHHHYVLQYHLYAAALHRYLALRMADYSYDRHFGGVYYLFLRGIDGAGDCGIYADRPPLALVEGILEALHPPYPRDLSSVEGRL